VAIIWLWRRYDARQDAALAKFVSAHLRRQLTRSISLGKRNAQRGLFLAALICLFVALAGPLVGFRWEQVSRRGNEIIFAIDTSRSMSTPDVRPNRLTRAKLAIDDFAKQLDGDAVGIVAFAGTAFLACPITLDYGALRESLDAIDTNTIPRGGTNISSAIQAAQIALRRRPASDKILILVTDGEDLEGGAVETARGAAQSDGLKIYTVGVGTAAGDLIPVAQEQGGGFVKDETGAFVRSRLDEPALKAIAAATGGFYVPLGTQGEGLEFVFKTVLGSIAKHDLASRQQRIYTERYQWPLAASLGMLLTSLLIGTRRREGARGSATSKAAVMSALISIMAWHVQPARAAGENTPAAQGAQGAQAAPVPDSNRPVLEYNAGTAAYRAAQFPQAAQSFQQSISHAPSSGLKRLAVQEDAYFNLGNALYRAGQKTEQSSPQETLQKWNDAVKAYETELQLRADDADSKFNRDLVKRKIDALKQQQNNNQQHKGPGQDGQPPKGDPPPKGGQPPKGDPPPQGGQPPKGDPPPQGGQPPKGDPPPQGGQPPKGDPPPQGGQPPKGDPPPQGGQPPKADPPPQGDQPPKSAGQPPAAPNAGEPQGSDDDKRAADNQRVPGQMTQEEARELLDSVKGDEHRSLGVPVAQRTAAQPPDKPFKNW
jgi:Ca-activated chloride channel family protein